MLGKRKKKVLPLNQNLFIRVVLVKTPEFLILLFTYFIPFHIAYEENVKE